MEKLKVTMKFLFVVVPFFVCGGLELIVLRNRDVKDWIYCDYPIKSTPKRKSDKQLFAEFMRRVLK